MKGILLPRYITKPKGEEAEPHMRRAKAKDRAKNPGGSAGLLRGTGNGTRGRSATELERPSPVAPWGANRVDKAEPKRRGAGRESEGFIVPRTARRVQPCVGKEPCLGRASGRGKDEGLAKASFPRARSAVTRGATTETGNPHRPKAGVEAKPRLGKIGPSDSREKVRELQEKLRTTAKRDGKRQFPRLYDRMQGSHVLWEAWRRVRANRGAAGVDGETLQAIERAGVDGLLAEIQESLRRGTYRPQPVRRQYIPKPDGRQRPLGIPTVRDRVVQMAAKLVMEPIFEADFRPCSYGFRPGRSAIQALEKLRESAPKGYEWALEVDIEKYFDTMDQNRLIKRVERRVTDRRVLKLIRQWLRAGVLEGGEIRETLVGSPQGGVISPLLANIYLHELDRIWEVKCGEVGILVRYADDLVVACWDEARAQEALRRVRKVMDWLGLKLHPEKTRIVHLRRKGIDFLGCHVRMGASRRHKGRWFLYRWPSQKAMKKVRERIRDITSVRHSGRVKRDEVLAGLSTLLRGWGEYYRTGNATRHFCAIDRYVWRRLAILEHRRRGWNQGRARERFHYTWYAGLPLYRLPGTIRYPGFAHAG